jgi:hypothetical protein
VTTLNNYEFQVADQLHDPLNTKWTLAQLDGYINEARRQLVMDTGCLRSLQQGFVTAGVEQYTFGQVTGGVIVAGGSGYTGPSVAFSGGGGSGVAATLTQSSGAVNTIAFTSSGSGYSSVPSNIVSDVGPGVGAQLSFGILNVNTYDVLDVHLIWGTERYSLRWLPFRQFSAWYRPFTAAAFQRQPVCWAVYGDTSIFLGPTPDQSYAVEFDTIILPTDLPDYVTIDPIPPVAQDPIKFYAAYLAKNNVQSYGEAENFLSQYRRRLLEVTSVYTGRIVDPYE